MILVIDNYDSFTWNLVHYLQEMEVAVRVYRNDVISIDDAMASGARAFLISPGPGTPDQAGISLDLVQACAERSVPLLGVCLGHQAIGQSFGATVARARQLMHGKTSLISHRGNGVFQGLPSSFLGTRYHSLCVDAGSVPEMLEVNAWCEDGTVMGIRHRTLPIHGVQYHPESICSEYGHLLLSNFLHIAGIEHRLSLRARENLPARHRAAA